MPGHPPRSVPRRPSRGSQCRQLRHRLPKVVALPGRGFVTFTIKAEDITAADHLLATRHGFAGIRCIFMQARAFLAGEGALAG